MTSLDQFQKPEVGKEVLEKMIAYFDRLMRKEKFRGLTDTERRALIYGFYGGLEYEQAPAPLVKKNIMNHPWEGSLETRRRPAVWTEWRFIWGNRLSGCCSGRFWFEPMRWFKYRDHVGD